MHHSILILFWTFMDYGHGGLLNFRTFRTRAIRHRVAQLVSEVDTSFPHNLAILVCEEAILAY